MIRTLMRINWINLKRDFVALGLMFVLPILFLSIFAMIFGGGGGGGKGSGPKVMHVVVVDQDDSEISARFVFAIDAQAALTVTTTPAATDEQPDPEPYTRESARKAVRRGRYAAGVVIPAGFGDAFGNLAGEAEAIEVIYDAANPIARHTVAGLLQAAAMTAAPDVLMEKGVGMLETFGGALTPGQRTAVDAFLPLLRSGNLGEDTPADETTEQPAPGDEPTEAPTAGFKGLVRVKTTDAREEDTAEEKDAKKTPSMVTYYAAGVGVMFLLFSMSGAAGALLEEEESGTLERVLTSNVGMGTLLLSNWVFFAIAGVLQLILMFVWAAAVFDLNLWTANHLAGFGVMTVATAAAAAAFGLVLATLCRTRAQLSGMSTILILIMSALGGSMVPRFFMPAFMETASRFTFNGWALDGYLKVFWYDDPTHSVAQALGDLAPEAGVLVGMTVVFLIIARLLARRWEAT